MSLLSLGVDIVTNSDVKRVGKGKTRLIEGDAVQSDIPRRLFVVPLKLQGIEVCHPT